MFTSKKPVHAGRRRRRLETPAKDERSTDEETT